MTSIIVELRIFNGIFWFAEYTYIVDGHRWTDQKNFSTIFSRGGISSQSKGRDRRYPPLLLR
jgi:hypothetical protein